MVQGCAGIDPCKVLWLPGLPRLPLEKAPTDGLNSILRLFEGEQDFHNFTKDRSRTRARIDMARASREANRVIVDFRGTDETSHIDSCTSAKYAGPDNPTALLSGSCRDQAGNASDARDFRLKYDSTPPKLRSVGVIAGDRVAVVRWDASPDTTEVEVTRSGSKSAATVPVYRGTADSYTDKGLRNGVRYRYAISGFDAARNAATRAVVAIPRAPLFAPAAGATVSGPPLLAWMSVPHTRYYNVQVWRNRKIFSAWPSATKLRLQRSWTYGGHRYRLSPGRYRWYVWPGRGPRSANHYGSLLGSSSFIVAGR